MPAKDRRADGLSKSRIVAAAIEILDSEGEAALTFRKLSAQLETGAGAIYWHVADKHELLSAATEHVISGALSGIPGHEDPWQAIRETAVGLFDGIDAHPWVGGQLAREPWQVAMVEIFEVIGRHLHLLGVTDEALFDAGSALLHYILGVAVQNAANARLVPRGTDRDVHLGQIADRWMRYDTDQYPFVHKLTARLRGHDDREQFLAGIDFLLTGITTSAT